MSVEIFKILFSEPEWSYITRIRHDDPAKLEIFESSQLLKLLKDKPVIVKYNVAQYMLKNNLFYDYNHVMPCKKEASFPVKATTLYEMSLIAISQSLLQKFPIKISIGIMGKKLIATKNIDADTCIFVENPLFFAPRTTNCASVNMFCAYCSKYFAMQDFFSTEDMKIFTAMNSDVKWSECYKHSIPCDECHEEFYCSNECRKNSWKSFHSFVCTKNPNHKGREDLESAKTKFKELFQLSLKDTHQPGWPSNTNPLILIKIICQGIKDINRNSYCKTLITNKSKAGGKDIENHLPFGNEMSILGFYIIRKILGSFTSSASELQISVCMQTMHHTKNIFDILTNPNNVEAFKLSDREFALICFIIMKNEQAFASHLFVDDMKSLYSQLGIHCPQNAFAFLTRFQLMAEKNYMKDPEFSGIFVIQSCINHSCDRNSIISNSASDDISKKFGITNSKKNNSIGLHCLSKRFIPQGQEITTSYIGFIESEMSLKSRRLKLWHSHKFKCMCTLCKEDEGLKCKNCDFEPNNNTQVVENRTLSNANINKNNNKNQNNNAVIKKLMLCGKCRAVWYCSKDCQTKHWTLHKLVCSITTSPKTESNSTPNSEEESIANLFYNLMS